VLKQNQRPDLRVFVVWEPVISTDWGSPSPSLPGLVSDTRARHYWDHGRKLSARLGGVAKIETLAIESKLSFRMKDVIWDAALVYPSGANLDSRATVLLAPVVKFKPQLAAAIEPSR
jgi:hypothetical protein